MASASESSPLVLIIDDVEDNRDVYTQFLEHEAWRVATAADGIEGLTLAARLEPALIVLDLGLPLIDGWEVARRLKESSLTRDILELTRFRRQSRYAAAPAACCRS